MVYLANVLKDCRKTKTFSILSVEPNENKNTKTMRRTVDIMPNATAKPIGNPGRKSVPFILVFVAPRTVMTNMNVIQISISTPCLELTPCPSSVAARLF